LAPNAVELCRRLKATWKAFEERQLPILKEEKPGLKMSQYKDMLWKVRLLIGTVKA